MNIISNLPEENKDERKGLKYYFPLIAFMTACFIAMLVLAWKICQMPIEYEELIGEPIPQVVEEKEASIDAAPAEERPIKPYYMTDDDIIAAVVMGEAGDQDLLGKTAVAATVLNRADYFGLTVEEVVSAEGAYNAWPYYGLISSDCYRAVEIARENRDLFPETMMYFKKMSYHTFADDYNKIGDHYFSYIKENEQ